MRTISSFSELPSTPAVYALYGGQENASHVAYVGLAGSLKARIIQHLVRRDSSVTTGVNAVNLNPDHITKAAWWEHPDFSNRLNLTAAELVAFDIFEPVLRSRGNIEKQAKQIYIDENFYQKMKTLFENNPAGYFMAPTLQGAIERIVQLEKSMETIQKRLDQVEQELQMPSRIMCKEDQSASGQRNRAESLIKKESSCAKPESLEK